MRSSFLTAGCCTLCLGGALLLGRGEDPKSEPAKSGRFWIHATFGLDETVAEWDGSATIRNGRILRFESWSFEREHTLDATSYRWTCSTKVDNVRERSTYAEPFRGLLIEVDAKPETALRFDTKQGSFEVRPLQLSAGQPAEFLKGRASVARLGKGRTIDGPRGIHGRLAESKTEDDFPAIAVDGRGHRIVAWIAYDDSEKADRLCTLDVDDPQAELTVVESGRLQSDPQLLTDAVGDVWLFWTSPDGDDWNLKATQRSKGIWSKPRTLTTARGSDFRLVSAAGPKGELWLTWQSFRNGNGDIFAKRFDGKTWSNDIAVTSDKANEWEPAISVDPSGRAWIGFDSYRNGNYDVYLRSVRIEDGNATLGDLIPIAATADFEAHAAIEATKSGEVWVAYDAAGPNWGKDVAGPDTFSSGEYNDPIHAIRRVKLKVLKDGKLHEPTTPLPQKLDTLRPKSVAHKYMGEVKRFYELPQLARDADGRLWVFFRLNRQGYAEDPIAALWEIHATTFADGGWLDPILLPESAGRQDQRVAWARKQDAPLQLAWSTGHHMSDTRQTIRVGALPRVDVKAASPASKVIAFDRPVKSVEKPKRSWELKHGGKSHRVYFGDLHRHTDISWCYPTVDGSLIDAHRYALDASQLDFLAVTDHSRDTDPYPWWRTQKAVDLFHVPGALTTIFAYERSNDTPGGGHRNVFFLERDWPVFRSDHHYKHIGEAPPGRNDPPAALYPKLRGKGALTAAHTPVYSAREMRGTWSYHDPEVEPLVEIYQGFRRSYERPENNLANEASIWYALSRGYRLGFIASSDHVSTHRSYACVWAEGSSRKQLFEAMRSRRTYAATDRIFVEFRLGDALMGEETNLFDDAGRRITPDITLRVEGTAPIDEIQLIRNSEVIATHAPKQRNVRWKYRDDKFDGRAAWYYVRVRQRDGNMAWASPVWVRAR